MDLSRYFQIQGVDYKPNVFTPTQQGTPAPLDVNIARQAYATAEKREDDYDEAQKALDTAIATARQGLHNDKETYEWFDNFVQSHIQKVKDYAAIGDYDKALKAAKQAAIDITSDKEYTARVQRNLQYSEAEKKVQAMFDKGEINETTYNRWKDENAYYDDFITDDQGNVIGTNTWNNDWTPVDDIDLYKFFEETSKGIEEEVESRGGGAAIPQEDGTIKQTNSDSQFHRKTPERIREAIRKRFGDDGGAAYFAQHYRNQMYEYNKLDDTIDDLKLQLLDENLSDADRRQLQAELDFDNNRRKYLENLLFDNGVPRRLNDGFKEDENGNVNWDTNSYVYRLYDRYTPEFSYNRTATDYKEQLHGGKGSGNENGPIVMQIGEGVQETVDGENAEVHVFRKNPKPVS